MNIGKAVKSIESFGQMIRYYEQIGSDSRGKSVDDSGYRAYNADVNHRIYTPPRARPGFQLLQKSATY